MSKSITSNIASGESQTYQSPIIRALRHETLFIRPDKDYCEELNCWLYVEAHAYKRFSTFRYRLLTRRKYYVAEPQYPICLPKATSRAGHAIALKHGIDDLERRAKMIGGSLKNCSLSIVAADKRFLDDLKAEIKIANALKGEEFSVQNVCFSLREMNFVRTFLIRAEDAEAVATWEDFELHSD